MANISIPDTSFNEGGADCPPIVVDVGYQSDLDAASMKGGRTAPR